MDKGRFKKVVALVQGERDWQDYKHGTIENHSHDVAEWLLILEYELGQAKLCWLRQGERSAMDKIRQVTGVGFAAMEQHLDKTRGQESPPDDDP